MVLVSQNAQFLHLVLSNLTIWFVLAEKFPAKVYVNQEKSLFDLHTLIKQSILLNLHELLRGSLSKTRPLSFSVKIKMPSYFAHKPHIIRI